MRSLLRLALFSSLFALPACSLVFDGSRHRGSGTDAGPVPTDTGPPISCGSAAECTTPGFYCDLSTTSTCMPGCDEDRDCSADETCDTGSHACVGDTPCTRDLDCAADEFCDSDDFCSPCDFDEDRYADVDAPASCAIRPAANIIAGGDCDDEDPSVHPFAAPDCNPSTDETCGVGAGTFSPDVFEIGLLGVGELSGNVRPESLDVIVLEANDRGAALLLVHDTPGDAVPTYSVATLEAGAAANATPGQPLVAWNDTGAGTTVLESRRGVVRNASGGGALLGSTEIVRNGGTGATHASVYAAAVDGSGVFSPAAGSAYRRVLGTTNSPTAVDAVAATFEGGTTNAFVGVHLKEQDAGGTVFTRLYFVGLNNTHFEEVASWPGLPGIAGAFSGGAGAAFETGSRSGLMWWNGAVGSRERFHPLDSLSSYRSGVASGMDGGEPLMVAVAATGGRSLTVHSTRCSSAACTTASGLVTAAADLGLAGGGEPLLTAAHLAGNSVVVAGRSGAAAGGLVVTIIEVGDPTAPVGSSLVLPLGELSAANDLALDAALRAGSGTIQVTVGFGMSTGTNVRYGALRICAPLPMP